MGFIILIFSYLLGSIPFGYILGKLKGVDLFQLGSGNTGATNAFRILGKKTGLIVFLCDFLKGALPAFLAKMWGGPAWGVAAGIAAVIGHNWSIFLRFRGGRGVSTSAGVLLALTPKIVLGSFSIWLLIVLLTGYVSLGSLSAALIAPVLTYVFQEPAIYYLFILPAATFIILRHLPNIHRLLKGTEKRIRFW